jgi:hypothetical protein
VYALVLIFALFNIEGCRAFARASARMGKGCPCLHTRTIALATRALGSIARASDLTKQKKL